MELQKNTNMEINLIKKDIKYSKKYKVRSVCVRLCSVWLDAVLTAVSDLLSGWCVLQPEKHGPGSGPPPGGF